MLLFHVCEFLALGYAMSLNFVSTVFGRYDVHAEERALAHLHLWKDLL
jgi:hypothetical protein